MQADSATAAEKLRAATETLTAAGIEEPRFEAQLLLALALGVTRTAVLAGLHAEPDARQRAEFARLVQERARRVPLAYLRGTREFYGLPFRVSPAVLIPRPETELLVAFALEKLSLSSKGRGSAPTPDPSPKNRGGEKRLETGAPLSLARRGDGGEVSAPPSQRSVLGKALRLSWGLGPPLLADVGTGSGCIAVATLAHCSEASAVGFDISAEALALARQNAAVNGVAERLRFVRGDLLTGAAEGTFDVVVSNPPYIPSQEVEALQPEVRDFEPRVALDGGVDGLEFQRRLCREARRVLRPGGWLGVEAAWGQAPAVIALLQAHGFTEVEARRDLAGIERLVVGRAGESALWRFTDGHRETR